MTAPLKGLTILDMTRLLPGPAATMHLVASASDVIKIETSAPAITCAHFRRPLRWQRATMRGNPAFEAINRASGQSPKVDLKPPAIKGTRCSGGWSIEPTR